MSMLRDITRRHFKLLNSGGYLPVEFLDVRLKGAADDNVIRLTSAGKRTQWGGHDYFAMTMGSSTLEEVLATDGGNFPAVTVNIQNVDLQMAELLNRAELEGSTATLWRTDRRLLDNPRDAIRLTHGEIRDPQINERTLTFQVVSAISLLDEPTLKVPRRMWQPRCNYTFGSKACGVDLNAVPNTIVAAVGAGSNEFHIRVPDGVTSMTGAEMAHDFWGEGYVLLADGPAAMQARPIQRVDVDGNRFWVRYPFLAIPESGNRVIIRRGCNKTVRACEARHGGSADQFGGFPHVPYGRIKPKPFNEPQQH